MKTTLSPISSTSKLSLQASQQSIVNTINKLVDENSRLRDAVIELQREVDGLSARTPVRSPK